MNEYKERKLAEFGEKFIYDYFDNTGLQIIGDKENNCPASIEQIEQFISDLIDEMVGAIPEKKELPKNIRIDEGFPIDLIKAFCVEDQGFNKCRETLINNLTNK
jgi:hypothetical protein